VIPAHVRNRLKIPTASFLFMAMDTLKRYKAVADLGEQLVAELEKAGPVDMLCAWMAHYIAEIMQQAERARGKKKREAQEKCFQVILRLWEQRARMPSGSRPFEEFEELQATLADLTPPHDQPRYVQTWPREFGKEPTKAQEALNLLIGIDSSAREACRSIIKDLLGSKVQISSATRALLEMELSSSRDEDIAAANAMLEFSEPSHVDAQRRAEKLEAFAELAGAVAKELRLSEDSGDGG